MRQASSSNGARRLAPAWYFGPLEQVVATEAAGYLLDAIDLDPAVPQR